MAMLKYAAATASVGTGLIGYSRYTKQSSTNQFPWFSVSPTEQPQRIYKAMGDLKTRVPVFWPVLSARAKEVGEIDTRPITDVQKKADWLRSARGSWKVDIWPVLVLAFIFSGSSVVMKLLSLLMAYVLLFIPKLKEMTIMVYFIFVLYLGGALLMLFFFMSLF